MTMRASARNPRRTDSNAPAKRRRCHAAAGERQIIGGYFSTLRASGEPVIIRDMPETDPLIGKTLGPCRLDALIGRGGMGRVYKARHLALDRAVAVKLVDAGGAGTNGAAL